MKPQPIIFLRHGKLDLPYQSHAEMPFSVLQQLGTQELSPGINQEYTALRVKKMATSPMVKSVDCVYTSPALRSQETGDLFRKELSLTKELIVFPELQEVYFDLYALLPADSEDLSGEILNRAVFEGIIKEKNKETVQQLLERASLVLQSAKEGAGTSLYITHDFFMRFLELAHQGVGPESVSVGRLEQTIRHDYVNGFALFPDGELEVLK